MSGISLSLYTSIPCQSVEYLSLKCCGIEDSFLSHLCLPLAENRTLLSLDLSCNSVGDRGAEHLATALRLNRTLLSLSLANNRVGNEGANAVAQVHVYCSALHLIDLLQFNVVMKSKLLQSVSLYFHYNNAALL